MVVVVVVVIVVVVIVVIMIISIVVSVVRIQFRSSQATFVSYIAQADPGNGWTLAMDA